MKLSDFLSEDFKHHGEIQLSEWVMNGDHYPSVKIYEKQTTNEWFQVSEKHQKYRQTEATSNVHQVQKYGEWKDLE